MYEIVAILETYARGYVAKSENAFSHMPRYGFWMLSKWLQEALDASGVSQSELSRRLTDMLGRSIDRAAVNKMLKGSRAIAGDELIAIQTITSMEAPSEIQVPLKGKVGAGQQVEAIDNGDVDTVPAPRDARPGTVAVKVTGTSMYPALEDGYLLYYSKHLPPSDLVNQRAVVQLADGRIFVKIIRPGSSPGLWTLQSVNALVEDMVDELVEWAAPIDWIRPR